EGFLLFSVAVELAGDLVEVVALLNGVGLAVCGAGGVGRMLFGDLLGLLEGRDLQDHARAQLGGIEAGIGGFDRLVMFAAAVDELGNSGEGFVGVDDVRASAGGGAGGLGA